MPWVVRKTAAYLKERLEPRPLRVAHITEEIMIRTITGIHSRHGGDRPLTPRMVAIACVIYCAAGLAIGTFDQRFLLMAWIMAGFLGLSLYFTVDQRLSLANPGTMFFSAAVLGCLAGYGLGIA